MFKVLSIVGLLAFGACVPIVVPVPIPAPQGQVRNLAAQNPSDVLFDQMLGNVRRQTSLSALAYNAKLAQAAQAHADDMDARGYLSHMTPEGADVSARVSALGLPDCGLGENIARGQTTSAEVFESWMASGPHRRNILNPRMASYGIGHSGKTWVLVLYAPC